MPIPPTPERDDVEASRLEGPTPAFPPRRPTILLLALVLIMAVASTGVALVLNRGGSATHPAGGARPTAGSSATGGIAAGPAAGTVAVPAGFPSASTTGVPAGTMLSLYAGPLTITSNGAVLDHVLVKGCLVLKADDVTIRNSKIMCAQKRPALYMLQTSVGAVVSHVEVDGMDTASVGIQVKNALVEDVNVHGSGDGVHLGNQATLQDSYIHDLGTQPNLHHDDLQTLKDSTAEHIRVIHNTLLAYTPTANDNSAYHLGSGSISDVLVEDNFIDGGHYSIEATNGSDQHDIVIRDNHFGRHYHYNIIMLGGKGDAVSLVDNVWQDDSQPATQANSNGKGEASAGATAAGPSGSASSSPPDS